MNQPRFAIFQLFDNVHILKKGGKVVYTGSKEACLPYFKALGFRSNPHENPADFLIDVASGMIDRKGHPTFTPEDLVGLWRDQYDVVNEASILQALWRENMDALSPRSDGSRGSGASSPRGVLLPNLIPNVNSKPPLPFIVPPSLSRPCQHFDPLCRKETGRHRTI